MEKKIEIIKNELIEKYGNIFSLYSKGCEIVFEFNGQLIEIDIEEIKYLLDEGETVCLDHLYKFCKNDCVEEDDIYKHLFNWYSLIIDDAIQNNKLIPVEYFD